MIAEKSQNGQQPKIQKSQFSETTVPDDDVLIPYSADAQFTMSD